MKKTISVNISGFIFNIEEEAYEIMLDYLDNLKNHLKKTEGGDEIYQDIEGRIAELFQMRITSTKEVVNIEDVKEVISIIGKPEEYLFDEDEDLNTTENTSGETGSSEEGSTYEGNRRVFRDKDHSIVGGVCSGIARYFDIDPILIRLVFAVLFFGLGTGVLLYIILWIVIPEAKTNADRLKMHGKKVNVENLKDQFQKVKSNPKRKKEAHRSAEFVKQVGGSFFRVFGKFIGGFIILITIFMIIAFFSFTFGGFGFFVNGVEVESISFLEFSDLIFRSGVQSFFAWLGMALVTLVPMIALLIFGIKILFKLTNKYIKVISIALGVFWIVGVGITSIIAVQVGRDFTHGADFEQEFYKIENTDLIVIDVMEDEYFSNNIDYNNFDVIEMIQIHDNRVFLGYPELTVRVSPDSNYHIVAIYTSRGISNKNAIRKAENIDYIVKKEGNKILFSPYFSFPIKDKYRGQMLEIVVQVPEGKHITFGPNSSRILNSFGNERKLDSDKVNKTYEMRGKDLFISNYQENKKVLEASNDSIQ